MVVVVLELLILGKQVRQQRQTPKAQPTIKVPVVLEIQM
jgi:hypothetical protein